MSRNNTIVGGYVNPLAFSPVLWIDFADASTVTTSSGLITQVVDKGSLGTVFTQGTGASRPAYISSAVNGLNVARFDGTDDSLVLGSTNLLRNVSGATIYVVRKWTTNPTSGKVLFGVSANLGLIARAVVSAGATSGKSRTGGRTLDADSFQSIDSTTSVTTGYQIDAAVFDYANTDLFLYLMGAQEATSASYQSATATSNTAAAATIIGANQTGSAQYADCDICEILVFHSAHNTATRTSITQYLRSKWGI